MCVCKYLPVYTLTMHIDFCAYTLLSVKDKSLTIQNASKSIKPNYPIDQQAKDMNQEFSGKQINENIVNDVISNQINTNQNDFFHSSDKHFF